MGSSQFPYGSSMKLPGPEEFPMGFPSQILHETTVLGDAVALQEAPCIIQAPPAAAVVLLVALHQQLRGQ